MSEKNPECEEILKRSLKENPNYLSDADEEGRIPLHFAALQDNVDMGRLLISAGSNINAVDLHGNTPLHNSCYHNSPNFTTLLISKGAILDLQTKNLDTPLDYATEAGHLEIVKSLINAGAKVNLAGENNWTPLHNAASITRKVAIEIVTLLLKAGANPVAKSGDGQYPCDVAENATVKALLIEAKSQAHTHESLLLEPGILSSRDSLGRTPLHQSILTEDFPKCRALLAAGARVDAQDDHGNTPLHNASYHNSVVAVKLLLAQPSSREAIALRTTEGDSALDYACANSHVEVARALIAAGADVNAQDERGWGALHNSCSKFNSKSIELIELLLESGANSLILNSDGQTPYDISREKSVKSLLKISMDLAQADIDFLDGGMEF